jgi:hypothetical protein
MIENEDPSHINKKNKKKNEQPHAPTISNSALAVSRVQRLAQHL